MAHITRVFINSTYISKGPSHISKKKRERLNRRTLNERLIIKTMNYGEKRFGGPQGREFHRKRYKAWNLRT